MPYNWAALSAAIKSRRKLLRLTQRELAERADVNVTTIRNLEGAHQYIDMPDSIGAVERALGWELGSAETVLSGGEPTIAPVRDPAQNGMQHGAASEVPWKVSLPRRVTKRLESGDIYAADVFRIESLDFILVAKPGELTPDDIERGIASEDETWQAVRDAIEKIAREAVKSPDQGPET